MRGPLRALVWAVTVVCLTLTTWYGMLYVLSVDAPSGLDRMDLDQPARPRLVLNPVQDGAGVAPGSAVVYRPADGNGTTVARVLFTASRNASGGYDVPALEAWNVTRVEVANVTWALPPTLGDGPGLYVADDRNATPHAAGEPLVALDRVEGSVLAVHDGGRLLALLVVFLVGSLLPLGVLLATQRPKRAPPDAVVWDPKLAPTPPSLPCPDCGRSVSPAATFCLACGAYLQREGEMKR